MEDTVTVVYNADGGKTVQVADSVFLAGDQGRVLLGPALGAAHGMYILDLDTLSLVRIDARPHGPFPVRMVGGIILWDNGVARVP